MAEAQAQTVRPPSSEGKVWARECSKVERDWGGLIEVCRLWLPVPLALGERLRTPNLANLDDSLSWASWEDLPTHMQDKTETGRQTGGQTNDGSQGVGMDG